MFSGFYECSCRAFIFKLKQTAVGNKNPWNGDLRSCEEIRLWNKLTVKNEYEDFQHLPILVMSYGLFWLNNKIEKRKVEYSSVYCGSHQVALGLSNSQSSQSTDRPLPGFDTNKVRETAKHPDVQNHCRCFDWIGQGGALAKVGLKSASGDSVWSQLRTTWT